MRNIQARLQRLRKSLSPVEDARIGRLEGHLIAAESDGKLPLALIRRCAAGSLTREEYVRWRTVIKQVIAAANSGEDQING